MGTGAQRHVEVAGAGFAGLTLATALVQRGWTARVHEAAPELRNFGAGIFLWENGLKVYQELGGYDDVLAASHSSELWEERDNEGNLLGTRPFPLPGGIRMITLTRQDLYAPLLEAARSSGVEFVTSSRVVAAEPEGVLVTEDGSRYSADLVVGADGIRSNVRDSLDLAVQHQVFRFGIYRFLVPLDRAPGTDGQWRNYVNYWNLAQKRRVLYVPCNPRDLYLLLGAVDDDPALEQPLDAATWQAAFPVLAPVLTELPASPRFDNYEVLRLDRWSTGRVAIVGDAAHAMPPTIGQGAGTAMNNALNLAATVANADDVEAALAAWEEENRQITDQTQDISVSLVEDLIPREGERRDGWDDDALRPAFRSPVGTD